MKTSELPAWAQEMNAILQAGATSQFVLHGNVFDLVPEKGDDGGVDWVSLPGFLARTLLADFDVVLQYDRSKGIRVPTGSDHFHRFLKGLDAFLGTTLAGVMAKGKDKLEALDSRNQLPREPKRALELIDRFLIGARGRSKMVSGKRVAAPLKVGVILDYAQFIAPQGDPLYLSDLSQTLIQILHWGSDPGMSASSAVTVLLTENLNDLNRALIESPYSAKIRVTLPGSEEIRAFVDDEASDEDGFDAACEVSREALADKLVGLSRASIRALLRRALRGGEKITAAYLTRMKKELIEKEAAGRLEFIESSRTLDDVAGHDEAKAWLRQDAVLLRRGRTRALPMGYLLAGRIGTGKTYLVECLAGEIGIPCVELRNFREKWVGATEGNLEKVFSILHALGQVIVFVDEADQMTGKRGGGDGDSGPLGTRLRDAGQGDVRHRQPREDHLDLRHLATRPPRGRPQAPGPARRAHPAVPAGRPRGARRALRGHGPQAPHADRPGGPAAPARQRRDRRQRDGGNPGTRAADLRDRPGRRGARGAYGRDRAGESGGGAVDGGAAPAPIVHRRGDRRLPALGARGAASAHGSARGQGVHRHPLPAQAVPLAESVGDQRADPPAQDRDRRVALRRRDRAGGAASGCGGGGADGLAIPANG